MNSDDSRMKAILIKDGKGPLENLYIGETERPRATLPGQAVVKVCPFRSCLLPGHLISNPAGQIFWCKSIGCDVSMKSFHPMMIDPAFQATQRWLPRTKRDDSRSGSRILWRGLGAGFWCDQCQGRH